MSWKSRKEWSDKFFPEIKSILGVNLIGEPPIEEDAERNTDLIVLRMDAVRIACRVRTHQYLLKADGKYRNEFTMRCSLPSRVKTELAKVIEGWGDYFFYGFSDESEETLASWILGDLKVFRLWFMQYMAKHKGAWPGLHQLNADGSSGFIAFNVEALPEDFIIARKKFE